MNAGRGPVCLDPAPLCSSLLLSLPRERGVLDPVHLGEQRVSGPFEHLLADVRLDGPLDHRLLEHAWRSGLDEALDLRVVGVDDDDIALADAARTWVGGGEGHDLVAHAVDVHAGALGLRGPRAAPSAAPSATAPAVAAAPTGSGGELGRAEGLGEDCLHSAQGVLERAAAGLLGAEHLLGHGGRVGVEDPDERLTARRIPEGRVQTRAAGGRVRLESGDPDLADEAGMVDRTVDTSTHALEHLRVADDAPRAAVDEQHRVAVRRHAARGEVDEHRPPEVRDVGGLLLRLSREGPPLHGLPLHGDGPLPDREDVRELREQSLRRDPRELRVGHTDLGERPLPGEAGPVGDAHGLEARRIEDLLHDLEPPDHVVAGRGGDVVPPVLRGEGQGGELAEAVLAVDLALRGVNRVTHLAVGVDHGIGEAGPVVGHGDGRSVRRQGVFPRRPEPDLDLRLGALQVGGVEPVEDELGEGLDDRGVEVSRERPSRQIAAGRHDDRLHWSSPTSSCRWVERTESSRRRAAAGGRGRLPGTECSAPWLHGTGPCRVLRACCVPASAPDLPVRARPAC